MSNLMNHLSEARPTENDLDGMWSSADRAALLTRIQATSMNNHSRRYRYGAALGLVAAATTAFVVLPPTVETPEAAAADLRALALTAAAYDGPVLAEGTWLHEVTTTRQENDPSLGNQAVLVRDRETWTRWDGRVLSTERDPVAGWATYDVIDNDRDISDPDAPAFNDPGTYQDPTPEFAATLPDTAEGLLAYLDGRVFGSSNHEEALYEALTGLATSHTLPPKVLAATYGALAQLDGVRTEEVRVEGRPAVEVTYTEAPTNSTETVVIDQRTGQTLSTRTDSNLRSYTSTTTLSEIVTALPRTVANAFETYAEGVRYPTGAAD